MTREKARRLRKLIVKASASLEDAEALEGAELFPAWRPQTDYAKGQRVRYGALLYRLIPEFHHSQADWTPDQTPAIWSRIDSPAEEWPAWRQPLGEADAYPAGARVTHNGRHWINTHGDGNVWEPGVYGWAEQ